MSLRKSPATKRAPNTGERYAAPALDKGLDVIELLARETEGLTLNEIAQISKLRGVERDGGRAPQKPADADETMIVREPFEIALEIGRADFELANEKRKERIVAQQVKNPLIVFD